MGTLETCHLSKDMFYKAYFLIVSTLISVTDYNGSSDIPGIA